MDRIKKLFFLTMIGFALTLSGCSQSKSTEELLTDLKSGDDLEQLKAVRWLQHRKGDAASVVPALIESLDSKEPDIRLSAAIGLGYFGAEAESAIPSLEKTLKDKDGRVRNAARVAISRIQG